MSHKSQEEPAIYVPVTWQAEKEKIYFLAFFTCYDTISAAPKLFSIESTINLTVLSLLKFSSLFEEFWTNSL